jgi:hypothetical protein
VNFSKDIQANKGFKTYAMNGEEAIDDGYLNGRKFHKDGYLSGRIKNYTESIEKKF